MTVTKQVFSPSSVATYLRCGKQWEYAYVYAIKSPPKLRTAIGLAAHEAVETNFRQKMDTGLDMPLSDVTDVFSDVWDRIAPDIKIDPDEAEKPGDAKDSGIKVVHRYQVEVAPPIQPVLVEQQVQFRINEIPFSGYVDVVDQHQRVRDLKTVGKKPSRNNYVLAMIAYAIGFRQMTKEKESGVTLDYIVRTKKPYYHPVPSEGPVPDTSIVQFANVVAEVAAAVSKGVFPPTGLTNNACSWCGYNDICEYYVNTR